MTKKTYKFSYERRFVKSSDYQIANIENVVDDRMKDYMQRTKEHIRLFDDQPDFEFPLYYRCEAKYTLLRDLENLEPRWLLGNGKWVNGVFAKTSDKIYIGSSTFVRYKYNNMLEAPAYPFNQYSDEQKDESSFWDDYFLGVRCYDKETGNLVSSSGTGVRIDVTLRYSDDDPSAGDEPKKLKQYLVSLDFGGRKSRRNKSSRCKYRKFY